MELTINIKEQKNIAAFLNMIKEFNYVEIVDVKEGDTEIPEKHKQLLDERLSSIKESKTSFKSWESVKQKYEGKAIL